MQLLLKQKQQLPNRHHFQSSSQPQSPQRTSSLTPGFQFHLWNSSKPHQLHQYSLGFTYALTYTILNACLLTVTIIENQRAEKKNLRRMISKPLSFFWWAIDFGNEGLWRRRGWWWWSLSLLASKSSRASCPVLLWCLRAEFGLAWVSALDGLFIFSGAGRCAMRVPLTLNMSAKK